MKDRSRVLLAAVAGAALGGIVGYLYLTEGGRRLREQIEPRLGDLFNELGRMRGTMEKARAAASESWRSLSELVG